MRFAIRTWLEPAAPACSQPLTNPAGSAGSWSQRQGHAEDRGVPRGHRERRPRCSRQRDGPVQGQHDGTPARASTRSPLYGSFGDGEAALPSPGLCGGTQLDQFGRVEACVAVVRPGGTSVQATLRKLVIYTILEDTGVRRRGA